MWRYKPRGFTLLELMVVVAIVALLAALAYNNYSRYALRSRRVDGQNLLTSLAAAEQRFYTNYNNYTATITGNTSTSLGFSSAISKYYTASAVVTSNGQSYTLTATPNSPGSQEKDQCKTLTLTDTGVKSQGGNTSNGPCW